MIGEWIDVTFHSFDFAILQAIHDFVLATGGFFNLLMLMITSLANDGLGMIALGLVLFCFKRTRKVGMAVLFGIAVGALITNVTLKPIVFRARPYTHEQYRVWWEAVGAHLESERSFPSGHTTSAMAAMMGIFLTTNKKYSWTAFLFAILMGFTRMYFVVHYPTDILGGLVAGAGGGLLGFLLVLLIYRAVTKHQESKLCRLFLEADPIVWCVRRVMPKKCEACAENAPAEMPSADAAAADDADAQQ